MKSSAYIAARVGAVTVGLAMIAAAIYLGFIALVMAAGHQSSFGQAWDDWLWRVALLAIPVSIAATGIMCLFYRTREDWRRLAIALLPLALSMALLVALSIYRESRGDGRSVADPCAGLPASACRQVEPGSASTRQ